MSEIRRFYCDYCRTDLGRGWRLELTCQLSEIAFPMLDRPRLADTHFCDESCLWAYMSKMPGKSHDERRAIAEKRREQRQAIP